MKLSKSIIDKIITQQIILADLSTKDLASFCEQANLAYRSGEPIISDEDYDFIYLKELKKRDPNHFLLQNIETEGSGFSEEKVLLPEPMLSIDKAYSLLEIEKWIVRIQKIATEINFDFKKIQLKAMPKLDGFAGFDDGERLYTRGDGRKGSDITRVFNRGLQVFKDAERGLGAGEIVVKKSYFEQNLSNNFEYPRNFQASLIKEKALDENAQKAINAKAALFVPFSTLPSIICNINKIQISFESIVREMHTSVDFDVDGVVFEVINSSIKVAMGANRKFHRWQIAFKENKDKAQVRVIEVIPQVGRTGKITPVAHLEPTFLSGATIQHASAHHYGLVKKQGLGVGSIIELTRSGLVIPKINKVLKSTNANIPEKCPSCKEHLIWDNDFLMCNNHQKCPAQIIGRIEHFFHILGNNDGFGIKTIEKLYEFNITKISEIYALNSDDFIHMGFGEKTAYNLIIEIHRSINTQIEDWRFLAAFGIIRLGGGNSENLLKVYPINSIFELTKEQISNIDGFADLTAKAIFEGLKSIKEEFLILSNYQFNLEKTQLHSEIQDNHHVFFGKKILFTGKMQKSRNEMKKHAKSIGAEVVSTISGKTDLLVIGEKAGDKKIQKATELGIDIITQKQYFSK